MNRFGVAILLLGACVTSSFGQIYAGERFSASAGQNVSLNGGNLILNATTTFSGSALPGFFAPGAAQLIPGTSYAIGPGGLAVTYTVEITYNPKALPYGVSASSLQLYEVVNGEWAPVAGSTVNTTTHVVTGKLTSTATFGVLSGTPPAYESAIYYRDFFTGDATARRILTASGKSEPLASMVGLTGVTPPNGWKLSPSRNGLVTYRPNPAAGYDIYVSSIDGSDPAFLAHIYKVGEADVSADGMSLYGSSQASAGAAWEIVKISLATGAVTNVHAGGSSAGPSASATAIAFSDGQTITTITSTGTVATFNSPTADGAVDEAINVSRDGSKVIWATHDGAVYSAKINGSSMTKLIPSTANPMTVYTVHWSPDGTMFVLSSSNGTYIVALNNLNNPSPLFPGNNSGGDILGWQ